MTAERPGKLLSENAVGGMLVVGRLKKSGAEDDELRDDPVPRDQSAITSDFSDIPIMSNWIEPEEQKERSRDISELPPGLRTSTRASTRARLRVDDAPPPIRG